ncbi:MAG: hypothetical protein ABF685_26515 [Clostridium saccharoperbutylacetonicum]
MSLLKIHYINTIKELGYYINLLISVLLGVIIFKEKLNFYQKVSIVFVATGVLFIVIEYGKIP